MTPERGIRYATFYQVWRTIRDAYFDPGFNGLDWEQIRKEYEPKVEKATSNDQLHTILNAMINRLGKSHLAIVPPEVYEAIRETKEKIKSKETRATSDPLHPTEKDLDVDPELDLDDPYTRYGLGLELGLLKDQFVITHIDRNSAAEYAGLRTGYVIETVNGVPLSEMMTRILIHYSTIRATADLSRFIPAEVVSHMINGEKDAPVTIGFLDESDKHKELTIRRERLSGRAITIAPNFPELQLNFEVRSIDDQTGYIRFNMFAVPVIEKFCNAIREFKARKSIIIDLRGNMGGIMASLKPLAGMVTDSAIGMGTSIYRRRSEDMVALTKANHYKGRLVVLIDERTASAAEVFAASLRENGRALLVGERTAGHVLPAIALKLPTEAVMMFPIANYRTANGKYLEGSGVQPDRVVSLDRKSLLEGNDLQMAEAVRVTRDDNAYSSIRPVPYRTGELTSSSLPVPAPPPPPPPLAKPSVAPPLSRSGNAVVTIRRFPPGREPAAMAYIDSFLNSIGGNQGLRMVRTYSMAGTSNVTAGGAWSNFVFRANKSADQYSEINYSESSGEIREIYTATRRQIQADAGLDIEVPWPVSADKAHILWPILVLADPGYFPSLSLTGTFDRDGRKTAVIEGRTKDGAEVAFAFDVETKMLVNFTGPYFSVSYSDYRKVGDLTLPFGLNRQDLMEIRLNDIKLNAVIDPSDLKKKENCYDRP